MKRQLVLLAFVPADILDATAHFERQSAAVAGRFVDRLATTLDWLTENAESGSLKSFPNPVLDGVRTWWVDGFRSYVIAYRIVIDTVEVVGVLHAHRDLPAVLRFRM